MFYVYDTILSRRNTEYVAGNGFIRRPGETKSCFVIDSDDFNMEFVLGVDLDKAVSSLKEMFLVYHFDTFNRDKYGVEVGRAMPKELIMNCLCESGIELDMHECCVTVNGESIDLSDEIGGVARGRGNGSSLKYVFAGRMDGLVFLCVLISDGRPWFDYVVFAFSQSTGKYMGLFEDVGFLFANSVCNKELEGYVAKHIMLNPCLGETWFSKLRK